MTAPLPNAAVLPGRGDGSERLGYLASPDRKSNQLGIKNEMGFQRNETY
jgi:hypothetical protein